MRRLQAGAAAWLLAASSYASAAAPEGLMGAPMPAISGRSGAPAPALAFEAGAGRVAGTVARLEAEGRGATRGAAEMRIYRAASPAVVLVLAGDGFGSGALISADGKIVTNLHVVGDEDEVTVIFKPRVEGAKVSEGDLLKARVIRRDAVTDLAIVQVSKTPPGLSPLTVGGAGDVEVGADVHAIGHPRGKSWTYTRGVVSQIRRDFQWTDEDKGRHRATVIQTQTPINPGNSGGPLIDDQLRVVGINSFGAEGEGLNFAVSGEDVKAVLAMKADRLPQSATAAAGKACEPVVLADEPSDDPKGTYFSMDEDCDGKADYVALIPVSKDEAISVSRDDDGDGKVDTLLFDGDHDGDFDLALYDTNADGEPDLKGEFKDGEDEPFRVERIDSKRR